MTPGHRILPGCKCGAPLGVVSGLPTSSCCFEWSAVLGFEVCTRVLGSRRRIVYNFLLNKHLNLCSKKKASHIVQNVCFLLFNFESTKESWRLWLREETGLNLKSHSVTSNSKNDDTTTSHKFSQVLGIFLVKTMFSHLFRINFKISKKPCDRATKELVVQNLQLYIFRNTAEFLWAHGPLRLGHISVIFVAKGP